MRIGMAVCVCLALASCEAFERPTVSISEQAVIEAVMADNDDSGHYPKRVLLQTASVRLFLVGDRKYETFARELRKNAKDRDEAFRGAVENFLQANITDTTLVFPRPLPTSIFPVSEAEVRRFYDQTPTVSDALAHMRQKWGTDAIFQVSRPGFAPDGTFALICAGVSSGPVSGRGRFYLLKFDGRKWAVEKEEFFGPAWLS